MMQKDSGLPLESGGTAYKGIPRICTCSPRAGGGELCIKEQRGPHSTLVGSTSPCNCMGGARNLCDKDSPGGQ